MACNPPYARGLSGSFACCNCRCCPPPKCPQVIFTFCLTVPGSSSLLTPIAARHMVSAKQWQISLKGINGLKNECLKLNKKWDLLHSNELIWISQSIDFNCVELNIKEIKAILFFDKLEHNSWRLIFETSGIPTVVEYRLHDNSWKTLGTNIMKKFKDKKICSDFPESITVSAI